MPQTTNIKRKHFDIVQEYLNCNNKTHDQNNIFVSKKYCLINYSRKYLNDHKFKFVLQLGDLLPICKSGCWVGMFSHFISSRFY